VFTPARATNHVDNGVRVAGRYVIFAVTGSGYLVDTRARKYAFLGADPIALDGRALILSTWTRGKALHPRKRIMLVPVRSLPRLRRCGR
jgi:hypothetical protein